MCVRPVLSDAARVINRDLAPCRAGFFLDIRQLAGHITQRERQTTENRGTQRSGSSSDRVEVLKGREEAGTR